MNERTNEWININQNQNYNSNWMNEWMLPLVDDEFYIIQIMHTRKKSSFKEANIFFFCCRFLNEWINE